MSDKDRCKYSLIRLKQLVGERGVVSVVEEIEASAIEDPAIKKIWQQTRANFDQLEELLGN